MANRVHQLQKVLATSEQSVLFSRELSPIVSRQSVKFGLHAGVISVDPAVHVD